MTHQPPPAVPDERPTSGRWYTTNEAARLLGITQSATQQAIKRGTLRSSLINPRLRVIAAADLERYQREHLGRIGKKLAKDQTD